MGSATSVRRRGVRTRTGPAGCRPHDGGRDAESVAVGIDEVHLAPREAVLVDDLTELRRDGVDVGDVQVHQRVGTRVALVFGEIEPHASARDAHEPGEPGLELVLPLLLEAEARVPLDRGRRVLDAQDGDRDLVDRRRRRNVIAATAAPCGGRSA